MPLQTGYTKLSDSADENESELPPRYLNELHVSTEENSSKKARWNHIDNLDIFFRRVYKYYLQHGLTYMILNYMFELLQFLFIVVFTTFLVSCVDYAILFGDKPPPGQSSGPHKVTIPDGIIPLNQCVRNFSTPVICFLAIALVSWVVRLFKIIWNLSHYIEIKSFYTDALKISTTELQNITWQEIQNRMMKYQLSHQMCIHKEELTELDISHRIARFTNYLVAMINKDIIPVKFHLPVIGERLFCTKGYIYNLEAIFFWGIGSAFSNDWHLRADYKKANKRVELTEELASRIFYVALLNIILCPIVFVWQILFSFFSYAEIIRRDPGRLGIRRWSLYSRYYLRHFNELDHDLNVRLGRAYKPSTKYMNIFYSHMLALIAKNIAFFAGAMLAVLLALAIYDEFLLTVDHVLTAMTVLGVIVTACRALIPDEQEVYCPHKLMKSILCHIHYMPDEWRNQAHTTAVREEFSRLFQYKMSFYIEELISPLITPFVLLYALQPKSATIIDFLRQFTIEVEGVGDVCSFAEMDVRRHGDPMWLSISDAGRDNRNVARDGKTEISLINFQLRNPEWKPNPETSQYISKLREQALQENLSSSTSRPLFSNLSSLHYSGLLENRSQNVESATANQRATPQDLTNSANQIFVLPHSPGFTDPLPVPFGGVTDAYGDAVRDRDISMSTLILHELHNRQVTQSTSTVTSPREQYQFLRPLQDLSRSRRNDKKEEEEKESSVDKQNIPSSSRHDTNDERQRVDVIPSVSYGSANVV